MDVLGQNYTLQFLVRFTSHHFTVAIKADTRWVYIDDMCVSVKVYNSFQDLLHIIILVVGFSLFLECLQLEFATIIYKQVFQPVKLRHKS